MPTTECLGKTGMRVMSEQCSTCVFRPGNLMHLEPGRLAGMVAEVRLNGGYVTCHDTLHTSLPRRAICRGSWDRFKTPIVQIAERLEYVEWVDPKQFASLPDELELEDE